MFLPAADNPQLSPNCDNAGVEVDVMPGEAEHVASTKTSERGEADGGSESIVRLVEVVRKGAELLGGPDLHLGCTGRLPRGWIREVGDVAVRLARPGGVS